MTIDITAKMKSYEEFIAQYREGDETKSFEGKNLLFYAISNNDPESRYKISKYLISKGSDVTGVNEENENLLHILLSRTKVDLNQTIELCEYLIKAGVDINQPDIKGRYPIQYLINMKYSDDELEPLYELWFGQRDVIVAEKNAWDVSPIEMARKLPYRKKLVGRMEAYEHK